MLAAAGCLLVILGVSAGVVYRKVFTLRQFREMIPGQLYHSRQPVNDFQYGVFEKYSIKRVINLRMKQENPEDFEDEKRRCENAGIEFVNIPVVGVIPTDEQLELFLVLAQDRPGPTLFHCEHGRNRTLFVRAAYRIVVENWPADAAMVELERDGAGLAGGKRERITEKLKRIRHDRESWLARTGIKSNSGEMRNCQDISMASEHSESRMGPGPAIRLAGAHRSLRRPSAFV